MVDNNNSERSSDQARHDVPPEILDFICKHINKKYGKEKRVFFRSVDKEDLIHAGVIAFLKAREKFDPSRGTPIERFSQKYIIPEIRREAWKAIVEEEDVRYAASVSKAKINLENSGESDPHCPNITKISRRSKVPEKNVIRIIRAINFWSDTLVLDFNVISDDKNRLDAEKYESSINQEEENEDVLKGQDSSHSKESKNQSDFHGKEYVFIFPKLISLLEERDEEDDLMTKEQKEKLLTKLGGCDLTYEKRLALKRLALSRDDALLALSDSLFSLKSQAGENDVYQKRKMWKQQEEAVLKESDLTDKLG